MDPPFIKGQEPFQPISAAMLNAIIAELRKRGMFIEIPADMNRHVEFAELQADLPPSDEDTYANSIKQADVAVYDHDAGSTADKYTTFGAELHQVLDAQEQWRLTGERLPLLVLPNAPAMVPLAPRPYVGKLDGTLSVGSSATMSIWEVDTSGTFSDSTRNITVYDWFGSEIASGSKVAAFQMPEGRVHYAITDTTYDFTADSGGTTTGTSITIAGGTNCSTVRAGDVITVNATDTDTTYAFTGDSGGNTTGTTITIAGGTGCSTLRAGDTITVNVDGVCLDGKIKLNSGDTCSYLEDKTDINFPSNTSIGTVGTLRELTLDPTGTLNLSPAGNIIVADGINFEFGSTTGTRIGTGIGDKLCFYGATPIVQPLGSAQGAITDNTSGSGSTLPLIGDTTSVDQGGNLNNALFALWTLTNAHRDVLVNLGLMKGSA